MLALEAAALDGSERSGLRINTFPCSKTGEDERCLENSHRLEELVVDM